MNQQDLTNLLKRSLHTIETLKERQNKQHAIEPIAIIGMACRFPGESNTPEKFWSFLENGKDGVIPVPEDRWHQADFYDPDPEAPDKMYVNEAGFLTEDISAFDARLFNISPREASEIDPQQRLLLETTWEAIERCGIDPKSLKKSQTGVFVGIIGSEYITLPRASISAYSMTGSTSHMASGRISHILGLQGPAISIDTACSSALTAIHLACEGIWCGTCQTAIAGGTNLMLTPYPFISLSKIQALAKDGRCKSFDASGDGYGRGEGCGMVVLKKLSDAQKNDDPIQAVILSSVINHDGPSSGLTVPNRFAQTQIYQDALRLAGKAANDISYIESHGTGTSLGDPIEMQSITDVYSKNRGSDNPLIIGSVKANIGHLEGAAGISALIKTVLCIQHKRIPPQIHLNTLNPRIHLDKIPAVIPTSIKNWNVNGKSRMAGISSFGFSGTNAHLIVSEYDGSMPDNTTQLLTQFKQKSYWIKSPPEKIIEKPFQIQSAPFDCKEMPVPFNPADYFVYTISFQNLPDLKDIHGIIHVGYFYLMLFKAIEKKYGITKFTIEEMKFQTALLIPEDKDQHIYLVMKTTDQHIDFQFTTCVDETKKSWLTYVDGSLVLNQEPDRKTVVPDIQLIKQNSQAHLGADFYDCMENNDASLGASVQWIERLWIGESDILTRFRLPMKNEKIQLEPLNVHPGIFDACAQLFNAFALMGKMDNQDMTYMVVRWHHFYCKLPDDHSMELWGYLKMDMDFSQKDMLAGNLILFDDTGNIISQTQCEMKGLSKELKQKMAEMKDPNSQKEARHLNEDLLNKLKNNDMAQRKAILTHYLCEILSPLLEMDIEEMDAETPIRTLGMDSLMGLTFKQTIEDTLPLELPVEILIEGPGLGEIAETLLQLLPGSDSIKPTSEDQKKNYLMDPKKWLPRYQKESSAKVRLLCFAHGSAGASLFNDWIKQMPSEIEVCPIQLPGKEDRLKEDPIDNIPELIDALVQILSPLMDRPYALLGNSYGSLIAFRLARQLNASLPDNKPLHLFASAYTSPTIYPNPALIIFKKQYQTLGFSQIPPSHQLSSDQIETMIEKMINEETQLTDEFTKQFQMNKAEYKKYQILMFPAGNADLRMVDTYIHDTSELSVDIPLTVFHGKHDPYNSIKEMEAWQELTTGKFTLKVFDAGHLFIKEKQQQMIDIICDQLNIKGGILTQKDPLNDFKINWEYPEDAQLFWYRPTVHHYMQTKPLDFDMNVRIIREEAAREKYFEIFDSPMKGLCRHFNTYCYSAMTIRSDVPFEKIPEYNKKFSQQIYQAIETCTDDWQSKWLPEIKEHLAYWESFHLKQASNKDLFNHIHETIKRFTRMWEIHHLWGTPVLVAVGLFEDMYLDLFKDADQLEPYELLTGFDNEIVESGRLLWQLSQDVMNMPDILSLFQENDVQTIAAQIKKLPDDHAFIKQLNAYLKKYGIMADIVMLAQPFWSENPESVIRIIQNNLNQNKKETLNPSELTQKRLQKQKEVQDKLKGYPKPVVQKFDSLLEKAQICNQLWEGHTFWLDYPATFYTRRAILESARRLMKSKTLTQEQDVFYLNQKELLHAVEKLPEPVDLKKEIEERKILESQFAGISPPPFIGTPPTAPPPDDPIFRILMKFEPPPQISEKPDEIKGYAGASGVITGTARIARTLEEADKIKPGEILVAISTVCSWTPLFSSISAVVTDNGGILCHGAIVAREYGIPAVVGTGTATHVIQDGQQIEVNGNTGIVKILS